jgi:hypothetical protein
MYDEIEDSLHPDEPIVGTFTDVFAAQSVPPQWVIKDLLPPGLIIVGAPPKSGKSTLTMVMAALVAGYKCNAFPPTISEVPETGRVMGFSYEATAGELRHILEAGLKVEGEPDESILIADDPWAWRLDEPEAVEKMLWWLNEKRPKLAFLDPLRNFHALEEKDSGIIRLLLPLRTWAVKNDSAFVIVHHSKKPGEDSNKVYGANDLRGTSALFGIADGVLMLTPTGGASHFGRLRIQAIFKRAQGWERDIQVAAWGFADKPQELIGDLGRSVLAMMKQGPITMDEAMRQLRMSAKQTQDTFSLLDRSKLIVKKDRKWALTKT